MRWFSFVPSFFLICSSCTYHGSPAGEGTGKGSGDGGQNADLPSTCDEAFEMPRPSPCGGSPVGTWEAHVACGRGEAPIVLEPPCDDDRLLVFSWLQESGYYEFTTESWTFSGSSEAGYTAYYPEACLVSNRKQYECEVIRAYSDRECSWDAPDGMCSCIRVEPSSVHYQEAITITERTIEIQGGAFTYCQQDDLLWLWRGPEQMEGMLFEDVLLLKRVALAPE